MTRSPRELANQKIQLRKQQEKLLGDLLSVVDDLDRAAEHWQQAQLQVATATAPQTWWQRFWQVLRGSQAAGSDSTAKVVTSAKEGIEMIQASMLDVLAQHQVVPLPGKGELFDPETMHALGQQSDAVATPNTVLQEVVRGYRWKDRILREAQVIVAVAPTIGLEKGE